MRRVDFQVDGLSVDALVRARNARRLGLDLASDFLEVVEAATGHVVELSPLVLSGHCCRSVWHVDFMIAGFVGTFGGQVDELEDERTAGDDAAATREEISADDILKDGRLSRRL